MPAGFAKMTKGIASWGWSTVPQKHLNGRVLWYTQAKVIGGGSSINAQVYARGNAADYDAWAHEEGCTGWSYREVLPYFKRAEDNERFAGEYHGYGGPLGVSVPVNPLPISEAFLRAAQEYGIPYNPDFNGAKQEGVGHYQVTVRNARRSSAAGAYLKPIRHRPNLTIKTGALVTRVVVEAGRAVGVEVVESGGAPAVLRCEREVLVTSGGIGSPRLLLLSGIGPADHLRQVGVPVVHDLPGVGANLQDHLDIYAVAECSGDYTYDNYVKLHRTVWAGIQYILFRRGPVASTLFETGGFWYANRSASQPDTQFHLGLGSGIEAGVEKLKNPGLTLNSAFLQPRSRGTVRLKSGDPADAPADRPQLLGRPLRPPHGAAGPADGARDPAAAGPAAVPRWPCAALPRTSPPTSSWPSTPSAPARPTITRPAPVPWARARWRCSIPTCGCAASRGCGCAIPRSCRGCRPRNTNAPTIMIGEKASDLVLGNRAFERALEHAA